ncbi:MAG: 6-phosphofructokinase, partial [Deltaproteobacteria bacterium]|nr:6-phosphofructokinase [Deltaproteobacteria bacterium]
VQTVTEALDRLHSTAESHHRAMIVEVMGRDAGWIALESGIAGSADVILIPEIPYSVAGLCAAIEKRRKKGSRFSIIVVAEGAFPAAGEKSVQKSAEENFGVERLGGIAHQVARQMAQCIDIETRVVILGHLQRGGSPIPYDRILATRFGVKAVELIARGAYGRMVALKGRKISDVEIVNAVSHLNLVDPDGELVATAEALGIMVGR